MARLPIPGGDEGTWGAILNDYLSQEHNSDGTLKIRTNGTLDGKYTKPGSGIPTADIADGAVTSAKVSSQIQSSLDKADAAIPVNQKAQPSGVASLDSGGKIPTAQLPGSMTGRLVVNLGSLSATAVLDTEGSQDALFYGTLTQNTAITFDNMAAGSHVEIEVQQDVTGGRTLSIGGVPMTDIGLAPSAITTFGLYTLDGSTLRIYKYGGGEGSPVYAMVWSSVTQSVGTGTTYRTFDTVTEEVGGNLFDSAAPTLLTAPVAGLYEVKGKFSAVDGAGTRFAYLNKSNSSLSTTKKLDSAAIVNNATSNSTMSAHVRLAQGDHVRMSVENASGSAFTAQAGEVALRLSLALISRES